jgi:hypothetical protein
MISVYAENHTRPRNKKNGELLIGKAGGTYSCHSDLKG